MATVRCLPGMIRQPLRNDFQPWHSPVICFKREGEVVMGLPDWSVPPENAVHLN
jgi:hypothetical protein